MSASISRRALLAATCGLTAPRWASAQSPLPSVVWLSYFSAIDAEPGLNAFLRGLADRKLINGRDFVLHLRYAEGKPALLEAAIAGIAALSPKLVVTYGPAVKPLIDRGGVPVVFAFSGDAVEAGFVASLARPGRNVTGISYLAADLNAKRIELLAELVPGLKRVALLSNPAHPGEQSELAVAREASARSGLDLVYLPVRDAASLQAALDDAMVKEAGALLVLSDLLTVSNRALILRRAEAHRLPVASGHAAFSRSGSLFSYGPDLDDVYRRLAIPVDRILKGAAASDLPVERPTIFELVINLKAVRTLGLAPSPALLGRASELIE
jgi:putative ABC transport system substrate-binding protein